MGEKWFGDGPRRAVHPEHVTDSDLARHSDFQLGFQMNCDFHRIQNQRGTITQMFDQLAAKDGEIAELRARVVEQQDSVDQAVALAEYLEGHSKGAMAERVKTALSAKFAQERDAYASSLRELAACAYQAMGVHDAPDNWLDALSNAAAGLPFETESLLPYAPQAVCDAIAERDEARKENAELRSINATMQNEVVSVNQRLNLMQGELYAKDVAIAELRSAVAAADACYGRASTERDQARQDHASASMKLAQCILQRDEARECVGRLLLSIRSAIGVLGHGDGECKLNQCDGCKHETAEAKADLRAAIAATPEHLRESAASADGCKVVNP